MTKKNWKGRLRCRVCQDPVPRRQGARSEEGVQGLVLESLTGERKRGLSANSDEVRGQGKEILMKKICY